MRTDARRLAREGNADFAELHEAQQVHVDHPPRQAVVLAAGAIGAGEVLVDALDRWRIARWNVSSEPVFDCLDELAAARIELRLPGPFHNPEVIAVVLGAGVLRRLGPFGNLARTDHDP